MNIIACPAKYSLEFYKHITFPKLITPFESSVDSEEATSLLIRINTAFIHTQ